MQSCLSNEKREFTLWSSILCHDQFTDSLLYCLHPVLVNYEISLDWMRYFNDSSKNSRTTKTGDSTILVLFFNSLTLFLWCLFHNDIYLCTYHVLAAEQMHTNKVNTKIRHHWKYPYTETTLWKDISRLFLKLVNIWVWQCLMCKDLALYLFNHSTGYLCVFKLKWRT